MRSHLAPRPFTRHSLLLTLGLLAVASGLVTPAPVGADPFLWSRWAMPYSRINHVAIYDVLRDRLVLHGGTAPGPDGDTNETWALSLTGSPQWQWLGYGAMLSRSSHVAVYDPPGDRMVIFGGENDGVGLGDTWQLSLGTGSWSAYGSGSPPPAGTAYVAAFDGIRRRMLVVDAGGLGLASLYGLDLTTGVWSTLVAGTGPFAGFSAAVHDPLRDRLILLGSGVWELTLSGTPTWTQLIPTGTPPPDLDGDAVFDASRDRVEFVRREGTVWALSMADPPVWSQLSGSPLPTGPRETSPIVFDSASDRLLFHGGPSFNDTWAFALATNTWSQIEGGNTIPIRALHSAVVVPDWDAMVVFGGSFGPGNDTWRFALDGSGFQAVSTAGTPPTARSAHASIYDPVRQRVLVFGGQSGGAALNDVRALTVTGTPTWSALATAGTPPVPRAHTDAIYDPVGDRMIVFGGRNDAISANYRDVWSLSLAGTPTWSPVIGDASQPGCPLPGPATFTDPLGDVKGRANGQDLLSVHIAEPYFADQVERVVFTTKLSALDPASPPRRTVWRVFFDDTTDTDTTFFVGMTTCPSAAGATFTFGYVDSGAGDVARTLGVPDAAQILPNGNLEITMRKTQLGSAAGVGPVRWFAPIGASLLRVRAVVRQATGHNCNEGAVIDAGGTGDYAVTENCQPSSLPPLYPGSPAVYDSRRGRLVVMGASQLDGLTRSWALPLSGTPNWTPLAGGATASQRFYIDAAYDSLNDRVITYGGATGDFTSTLDDVGYMALSPTEAWGSLSVVDPPPFPRFQYSLVRDAARGQFVLYGGSETLREPLFAWGTPAVWFLSDLGAAPVAATAATTLASEEPRVSAEFGMALSSCRLVGPDRVAIAYTLPGSGELTIDVLDIQGRRLGRTVARVANAGGHEAVVQLMAPPAPGLYMVAVRQGEKSASRKFVVVR